MLMKGDLICPGSFWSQQCHVVINEDVGHLLINRLHCIHMVAHNIPVASHSMGLFLTSTGLLELVSCSVLLANAHQPYHPKKDPEHLPSHCNQTYHLFIILEIL